MDQRLAFMTGISWIWKSNCLLLNSDPSCLLVVIISDKEFCFPLFRDFAQRWLWDLIIVLSLWLALALDWVENTRCCSLSRCESSCQRSRRKLQRRGTIEGSWRCRQGDPRCWRYRGSRLQFGRWRAQSHWYRNFQLWSHRRSHQ